MSNTRACFLGTTCLVFLLAPGTRAESPRTDDYGDPLSPGAVARLGTTRLRHVLRDGSGAACVAFSPDGKTLVSGGDVGLRAWDVATGKDLGWFPTATSALSAQFTPDGKEILSIDNSGSICFWQAGTGKLLREIKQPTDNQFAYQVSFLAGNGKVAGVTGQGGGFRLWETETGNSIETRKNEGRNLSFSGTLSPDGKTLVFCGEGNRAHLLEAATGKEVRLFEGPNKAPQLEPGFSGMRGEPLYGFAFAPDGKSLAGRSGKDSICGWNVADGRLRFTIKNSYGPLAFSPDGKHLVCGGEEAMRLYDAETGKEVRRFERHPGFVYGMAFSPDGKTIASAHEYTIDLWDVATGKRLHPFAGHVTPVVSLAFSPDGTELASGDREDGMLIVWRLKDRKPRHTFTGHYVSAPSVAYSPDGKFMATGDGPKGTTGGFDAEIRLWDLSAGKLLRQFPGHINSVETLAFSPDGKQLASGGHDARTKVWDVATGQRLLQIRGEDTWSKSVAFAPDGKTLLVAAGFPTELSLWRTDSGRKVRDLGTPWDEGRTIHCAVFLPDGRTVVACDSGNSEAKPNEARFFDTESGRLLRSFSFGVAGISPGYVALSPDGNTLATVGDYRDPVIQLWDTTTGKQGRRLVGHNGAGAATALAFSRDGKTLASGGGDTTVLLWDVARVHLDHLWAELAGGQAEGVRASKKLAATPDEAIPFLKDRLRRAAVVEDRARRLITDLDDDAFDVREKASGELEALGPEAAFPLQLALQGSPSPEARVRLREVLDKMKTPKEGQAFQPQTVTLALAILEEIGTPDARRALEELAKGPAQSVVTREAKIALERLTKPHKP